MYDWESSDSSGWLFSMTTIDHCNYLTPRKLSKTLFAHPKSADVRRNINLSHQFHINARHSGVNLVHRPP